MEIEHKTSWLGSMTSFGSTVGGPLTLKFSNSDEGRSWSLIIKHIPQRKIIF